MHIHFMQARDEVFDAIQRRELLAMPIDKTRWTHKLTVGDLIVFQRTTSDTGVCDGLCCHCRVEHVSTLEAFSNEFSLSWLLVSFHRLEDSIEALEVPGDVPF
jgi:hypothetical protein